MKARRSGIKDHRLYELTDCATEAGPTLSVFNSSSPAQWSSVDRRKHFYSSFQPCLNEMAFCSISTDCTIMCPTGAEQGNPEARIGGCYWQSSLEHIGERNEHMGF